MELKEKTVALARLLHKDCTQLLEFYATRESLPSDSVSGPQLVSIPPLTSQLSPSEKICFLHAALRACLRLFEKAITQEDEMFPSTPDEEYTKQQQTVRDRLNHLVMSTERLLVGEKRCDAEAKDVVDDGVFALKQWILQVLQDLVYWSNKTADTLQSLPAIRKPRTRRSTRNAMRRLRR